ncbi:ATP-binding protein [Ochrobactrum quorumnocens]|uniref:histidine kinase n=1 Tax=Ochrobactrum quorumnocens TaxID=271865 RepID=A0A5N1JHH3_9HYPH|nr:ATP-binding protein [[Ochrobactrum] quorumnocens]KAA9352672.1 PAS domain S-box protein [[Ochrobactrum] quorumnocens]
MDGFTKIDRRTIRAYWTAAAFIILIATLGAATIIARDYRGRIDEAGQHAMNLAQTLAEYTTQIFVKLDALSRAIIEDSEDPIVDQKMLSEVMRRRAAAEPAARGIAIIDKNGRVFASGIQSFSIGKDVSKTPEFQVLARENAPQFYISKPIQQPATRPNIREGRIINYARRIENINKNFQGVVIIIVDEAYLYGFYNHLEEEPGRVIGLVGEDGIIRASNVPQVIGQNIEPFMREPAKTGKGIVINPSVRTGITRIFAYYRSSVVPLLAYVGVPIKPIYQSWLIASSIIATALLSLFAAIVALGIILGKFMRSRDSLFKSMIEATRERQEKEFLETIVNAGATLVAVTDVNGRFTVTNPTFRELFKPAEDHRFDEQLFLRAFGNEVSKISAHLPWRGVNTVTFQDGSRRELSWAVSAIFDKDGQIKHLVAIGLDITERRQAELEIYQSAKLVTLGEMSTGIAHEINQPLAAIAMAIDNAQAQIERENSDKKQIAYGLELASQQVDRAASIVRHMRIYGRRSDGVLQPVDPALAIDGALTIAQAQISDLGIRIVRDYNMDEHKVVGDILLIEQILLNLLLNARDAILDHSSRASINDDTISLSIKIEEDSMIAIRVTDTGSGIEPAVMDKLFDPFFTTKQIGKGTGLGLSLSHGMARDMGGHIVARNTGSGAEFALLLRAFGTYQGDAEDA